MAFVVAHLGARRHYAVPRILHQAGLLNRFFTDICAAKGWPRLLRHLPEKVRAGGLERLAGRVPHGVPRRQITTFPLLGLRYAYRTASARTASESTETNLWAGHAFNERVVRHGLNGARGVYAFNSAGLELLRHGRARGLCTVLDQTSPPKAVRRRILTEAHGRHPSWEAPPSDDAFAAAHAEREQAEWEAADVIVCGSPFVQEKIGEQGGPAERCAVVPMGAPAWFRVDERRRHGGPLRVLTAGKVCLLKGSPYVLEAARRLGDAAAFRMVGSLSCSAEAQAALRQHIDVRGAVPRSEMVSHYAWADVFLLPTLCEGSANVCYEALACGLPVVTTPNAGSIVRDGVEGFVVPPHDAEAVVEALGRLASDTDLREGMMQNARERSALGSQEAYAGRLARTVRRALEAG